MKLHVMLLQVVMVVALAVAVLVTKGLLLTLVILVELIDGRKFLVVHGEFQLDVLQILILMIILILRMMISMVVLLLKVVLILAALEIMVTISFVDMMDIAIDIVVILNDAVMMMAWAELKFPYLHLMARKMLMLILSGRPRWTRYLICTITLLKRRQSLLESSLCRIPSSWT